VCEREREREGGRRGALWEAKEREVIGAS